MICHNPIMMIKGQPHSAGMCLLLPLGGNSHNALVGVEVVQYLCDSKLAGT